MNPPYPVGYEADFAEERSRLTTFFRGLLVYPVLIVGYIYWIGAAIALFVAWFALMFTGRYPEGLYRFVGNVVRFNARMNGYYMLLTDAYPKFGLDEYPEYPIRVPIAPAKAKYSRLKVFFRGLLGIPVMLISFVFSIGLMFLLVFSWFRILFTGKQSASWHETMTRWNRYNTRATAYFVYLTEDWPPMGDEASAPAAASAA